jgi:cytochrome c oxidase assembly factor CtaG
MDPVAVAALRSWSFSPWLLGSWLLLLVVYLRGFHRVEQQMPERFACWRAAAFIVGSLVPVVAVTSPLDAFAGLLLQVHMLQHLLLTMVAPPLLWLGAPAVPLLRGLPRWLRKDVLGPFLGAAALQRLARRVTHPVVCWIGFVLTIWVWHVPALYEMALRSPAWHAVEHACFLTAGLLFWWPVVQPWPSEPVWPRWALIPYLLLADVQNTVFSALFTFIDRVIYPSYASGPRLWGITALGDQAAAGAIMWVPGSILFLVPVGWIIMEWLGPRKVQAVAADESTVQPIAWGMRTRRARRWRRWDLLKAPLLGTAIRWPYFRRVAQILMLLVAAVVVADGFLGPQVSPMNLAGVLPWTYWRGFGVLALLAVGNVFCMACPFTLPRDLSRRLLPAQWRWPGVLRSKWLAVVLVVIYLWIYEVFSLWDRPLWTAGIILAYFSVAFVVDGLFRGASFCKYVCPIGQFHFAQSLLSPLEVAVRDPSACRRCATFDCLRGNEHQRGCELGLFQPKKAGNFDCTFCLDCVHACPHDNVGVLAIAPGRELLRDGYRSSVGRWSRRPDIIVLVLVLVVGAFLNAAAMVAPVRAAEAWLASHFGAAGQSTGFTLLLVFGLAVGLAGAALCALAGRVFARERLQWATLISRFAPTLIPLGASMWCAHFGFHLATGVATAVPVVQRVASAAGTSFLGSPDWGAACAAPPAGWLLQLEILVLDAGLLLTLYCAWRVAKSLVYRVRPALALMLPWAGFAVALYAVGVWILFQPMQMRGMLH